MEVSAVKKVKIIMSDQNPNLKDLHYIALFKYYAKK